MKREEHLAICKICKKQEFDFKRGIICGLTNQLADFEDNCDSFEEAMGISFVTDKTSAKEILESPYDYKIKLESKSRDEESLYSKTSGWKRFANHIIDTIIIYIPIIIFLASIMLTGLIYVVAYMGLPSLMRTLMIFYILRLISGLFYYTFFEAIFGRTIGKFITRTRVIDYKGNTPSLGRIFLRYLCRCIPFESFSFLVANKKGLHDTLSKTMVVELKKTPTNNVS